MKPDTHLFRHVAFPAVLSVLFFVNSALPVSVLGCATRGLVALAIAMLSGVAGLITVTLALKGRVAGDPDSVRWIISTLFLMVPLLGFIWLA